jgi:hypothetical protein
MLIGEINLIEIFKHQTEAEEKKAKNDSDRNCMLILITTNFDPALYFILQVLNEFKKFTTFFSSSNKLRHFNFHQNFLETFYSLFSQEHCRHATQLEEN